MPSIEASRWQRQAVANMMLLAVAAGASAVLAYKLHQPRAADCGDFETCYNNAGAVRAFAVTAIADVAFLAVCISYRTAERTWVLAYGATAATAVAGLAILFEWMLWSRPPPRSLPTLVLAGAAYAGTMVVVTRWPTFGMVSLTAFPLTIFGLVSFLALLG